MSSVPAQPEPESCLEHLDWVRGLALQIVGDPAEADDLRQEVWLLAQRLHRPTTGSLRAWLGGILRNVVRDRRRASSTRSLHEERAALERATALDEPGVVREVAIQQVVVDVLVALPEPYRSTLLARYYEGLTPDEIAVRDELPVATVKTRLRRGLARVRERLGERESGGTSALAVLALSVWSPDVEALATASSSAAIVATVAGVSLVSIGAWIVATGPSTSGPVRVPVEVAQPRPGGSEAVELTPLARAPRTPMALPGSEASDAPEPAFVGVEVPIEVVDLSGSPVSDVRLRFEAEGAADGQEADGRNGPWTVTGPEGRATVTIATSGGAVVCEREGWLQFGHPVLDAPSRARPLLAVVAEAHTVPGLVVDDDGAPIAGAFVELGLLEGYARRVGRPLDRVALDSYTVRTNEEGAFEAVVPLDEHGLVYSASKPGFYVRKGGPVRASADRPLEIRLPALSDPSVVHGVVTDEDGEPIARAWAADGAVVVRCDPDGAFQIGAPEKREVLVAGAPGWRPVRVDLSEATFPLSVALTEPDLRISGRLVDGDGNGVEGVWVYANDCVRIGEYEFTLRGRLARAEMAAESFGQPETSLGVPIAIGSRTDARGAFTIVGLDARDYALKAFDVRSLMSRSVGVVPAGARGVVLDVGDAPPAFQVRVETPDGAPLVGARVWTYLPQLSASRDDANAGPNVRTDDEGRASFESLAPGARFVVSETGPWIHIGGEVANPAESGEVVVVVEGAARLELVVPAERGAIEPDRRPGSFHFRDEQGRRVAHLVDDLYEELRSDGTLGQESDGLFRPLPIRVPTRAVEFVLTDERGTLLAIPIELQPGESVRLEI
ncbi:MAG: sigma-70 family RNA polymerase sigma factor [Planctomycetota bacterium]